MYQTNAQRRAWGEASERPRPLPYSAYPKAADVAQHGLQPLPESLPLVDFARAKPYRGRYSTILATELTMDQLLQMAWVIATGFVRWEPQAPLSDFSDQLFDLG